MMTAAILIIEGLKCFKRRLSSVLSTIKGRKLTEAMFMDVLDAVIQSRVVDEVLVVSADRSALSVASERGANVVREEAAGGMDSAFKRGMDSLGAEGTDIVALVPCDLPLLKAEDLAFLLGRAREGPKVVLLPSPTSPGTSMLISNPPGLIPLHFEEKSHEVHYDEAAKRSIPADVYWMEAGVDVDEPADLLQVSRSVRPSRAKSLLKEWGIEERLGRERRPLP